MIEHCLVRFRFLASQPFSTFTQLFLTKAVVICFGLCLPGQFLVFAALFAPKAHDYNSRDGLCRLPILTVRRLDVRSDVDFAWFCSCGFGTDSDGFSVSEQQLVFKEFRKSWCDYAGIV